MDVILHLGAHRCGTTTLQKYLLHNETALGDAGVMAWGPRKTRGGLFSGLVKRPAAVTPDIARRGIRSCGLIALEINDLARAGYRELIVSEENMIGSLRSNLMDLMLYPEAGERLERFVSGFGADPRRIGLAIRSYDTLWASAISYEAGRGQPLPGAERIAELAQQPLSWRRLIRTIGCVFPRSDIFVWPFERFAGQPEKQLTILTDGLHIAPELDRKRDWFNRSPSCFELRKELTNRGEAIPRSMLGEGRWMPFDAGQQQEMRAAYAADLDWLRNGADGHATFVEAAEAPHSKTITTRGFAASDRTRVPPEGRQHNDNEKIVV